MLGHTVGEDCQPVGDVVDGGGTGDELDGCDIQAVTLQYLGILFGSREIPEVIKDPKLRMSGKHRPHCFDNVVDVTRSAKLGDEPTAGFEGSGDVGYSQLRLAYPMEHRIGKDSIKFSTERQIGHAHHLRFQPVGSGFGHHLFAQIDPEYVGSSLGDLQSQYSVSTAQIENPLSCFWCEQIHHRYGKF